MENRTCLDCTNFATCNVFGAFKDEKGRVPVTVLNLIAGDCKKYFNPKV